MVKAASVATLIRKFSSNTWPFARFFTAVHTISSPRMAYAIINKTGVTAKPGIARSRTSPVINRTAPAATAMRSFLFSANGLSFFCATMPSSLGVTVTSDSMEAQILRYSGSNASGSSAATASCFVANVMVAILTPGSSRICRSIFAAQLAQPRLSRM